MKREKWTNTMNRSASSAVVNPANMHVRSCEQIKESSFLGKLYQPRTQKPSTDANVTDAQLSQALYYINGTPWSVRDINSGSTCASMQWMPVPLYTSIPPSYLISDSQSQNKASPFMGERPIGKELSSSSIQNDSTEETREGVYASSPKHINKSGFVPYKRCSASTPVPIVSAKTSAEEDDSQRVRLCL